MYSNGNSTGSSPIKLSSTLYMTTEIRFVHIYKSQKLMMRIKAQDTSDRKLGGPLNVSDWKIYASRSNVRTSKHTKLRCSYLPNALLPNSIFNDFSLKNLEDVNAHGMPIKVDRTR